MYKNSPGYTLIEFIFVFVIISILTFISTSYVKKNKLKGATRMIYYDLHYARMAAIKERSKLRVIFDNTNGHTYQIHHDLNFNGDTDDGENVITKDLNTLFRGIRFSSNRDVASFNPFGTSNGGTITVIEGSKIKKIIFSWVGMVRVNDPGSDE